jgi:predicted XRE-type DNA-binding protein
MTLSQRFWSKVTLAPKECCWEWTGCKLNNGYGQFRLNNRRLPAHRVSYTLTKGEIPEGLMVRHTCDNRLCCNPDHLILGTHADNMADMTERKRQAKGEDNGKSKLTDKQVMEIYNSPLKQVEIAKLYNITQTAVSKIKCKKIWKHIHN